MTIRFDRRQALLLAGALAFPARARADVPSLEAGSPFAFDRVVDLARSRAAKPWQEPANTLPPALGAIDYDAWRDIRFRPAEAQLHGRFRMQMFHPGFLYKRPVAVSVVRDGRTEPVPFLRDQFDYGRNRFDAPLPRELGFAGIRLHFPLNDPGVLDELMVFLGASYFRVLSRDQHYGLSARGIAIGSGEPNEEFPAFVEFWVEDPAPSVERITVWALLDGPSLTGAYQFVIWPGAATGVEITAELFARRTIEKLGIAPLTSMFYVSENDRRFADEFRPEVHDSDGLLMHTGAGEWIWRPLRNPAQTQISSFMDTAPRGFGLMQRDRSFSRYEDLEARYDLRPSYWVEPDGDWGEGMVQLVELPAPDETSDNIVAFWVPRAPLAAGSSRRLAYRLRSLGDGADLHTGGRVRATFQSAVRVAGSPGPATPGLRRLLVDFTGGDLDYFMREPDRVEVVATLSAGRIARRWLMPNPVILGFRVGLDVEVPPGELADMRIYLRSGERALTETWTFPLMGRPA